MATKTLYPRCFAYAGGINQTNPLKIRVLNVNSFASATNFKIAFDNFNNPPLQKLYLVPINIKVSVKDRVNGKTYYSNFPSVYFSDSVNVGIPADITTMTYVPSSYSRGATTNNKFALTWPYTSSSNQKLVLKVNGGITCCNAFANFYLKDDVNTYTPLWSNSKANVTIYTTPSYAINLAKNIYIMNVVNPYTYQRDTYQNLKKITFLMYKTFKTIYKKDFDQIDFTAYKTTADFNIASLNSPVDPPANLYYHQNYPMTYDIRYLTNTTAAQFATRMLSYTILKFSAGVQSIDKVYTRY
jgi:hypothetical protein